MLEIGAGCGQLRMCGRLRDAGRFDEPWSHFYERTLSYTPDRYRDLIGSIGHVASTPDAGAILEELIPVLGAEPFDVVDLVWVIAARTVRS